MAAMTDAPPPRNEPVLEYRPNSPERTAIRAALDELTGTAPHALPLRIGGDDVEGTGESFTVTAPHRHSLVLGEGRTATEAEVRAAVDAALRARREWAETSFESRAAVFLRAADLLAGPWRARVNAATMLGQSKTVFQAEIDAAVELVDFWRFNVHFAAHLNDDQPLSPPGVWNRMELRPLEGFVLAITPFNFTSIGGNLPTAPALMGNTVVWKPATTQQLAASALMELLEEAGLPPGVINMVTGHSGGVGAAALPHPDLAGIHFTGSTGTFQHIWSTVAANLDGYRTYPRLVGETGGKDFVVAHQSASPEALL
ncbi:MAG TPA: aldehyde dehydrogenase family protein, partial [Candidatus Dormibacteraeota bacterium]|nr:aldehyde dehydrogenase family protein [Candidatus Dormibacteraeota bacterium]